MVDRSTTPGISRSTAALVVVSLVASVFIALPVPASAAEPEITFNGSGWGHGVGMSQWGAFGRAVDPVAPQGHDEILSAYYQGTAIGSLGDSAVDPGPLHTNVASDRTQAVIEVCDTAQSCSTSGTAGAGLTVVRLDAGPEAPQALLNTGDTVTIKDTTPGEGEPNGCDITVQIAGQPTEWGTGSCSLTIALNGIDAEPTNLVRATACRRQSVDQCWFGYGSEFLVIDNGSDQRITHDLMAGNGLEWPGFDLVVVTSLDEYTKGIAEVPYSWPASALRAQAIAARSYAAAWDVATEPRTTGCFCDVRNDSSYQVYGGWINARPFADAWIAAANDTAGAVLTHPDAPDAGIVRAFYSSSNGGASEASVDRWGGSLPYLTSVDDPWSLVEDNPFHAWSVSQSAATIVDSIWGAGSSDDGYTLTSVAVTARNASGSAATVRFTATDASGDQVSRNLSAGSVTERFGLPSWYFDVDDTKLTDEPVPPPPPPPAPDTAAHIGVQDPSTGIWTLRSLDGTTSTFYYGNPKDIPFIGDWNGDGIDTVGLYRQSVGFLFLRYTNTQGVADVDIYYGIPGDVPIAGDWNGDGIDTVGIYRPSESRFYLRNSNTQGIADIDFPLGVSGDVPIAGDWDGDGIDTVGVYRPSTKMVYLIDSLDTGNVTLEFFYEGTVAGDRIIAGDWNADGIDTVGVFRPSTSTFYLRDTFTQSKANIVVQLGSSQMNPIAGAWGN